MIIWNKSDRYYNSISNINLKLIERHINETEIKNNSVTTCHRDVVRRV